MIFIGITGITGEQLKPMHGHAIDGEQQAVVDALHPKFLQDQQNPNVYSQCVPAKKSPQKRNVSGG